MRRKYDSWPVTKGSKIHLISSQPHMSRIGWKDQNTTKFHCGGSLISENFVVSAAHCRRNSEGSISNVVLFGYEDEFDVEYFLNHPDYNSITKYNDIALIKLSQAITFVPTF